MPWRLLILHSGKSHAKGPPFLLPASQDFLGCAEGNVLLLETGNDSARQSQTLSAGGKHTVCPAVCFSPQCKLGILPPFILYWEIPVGDSPT